MSHLLPIQQHLIQKLMKWLKMLKPLTKELARLKLEEKWSNRPIQEPGGNKNPNQFRIPQNDPQIMQRERRNHEDQRIFPPF